jgi:biotin synthase
MKNINKILEKIYNTNNPKQEDLEYLLALESKEQINELFSFADKVRKTFMGDGVFLRGIIEFSNFCKNTCFYCGLNKNNTSLERYRLNNSEILAIVDKIATLKIKTVVLQAGEEDELDSYVMEELIKKIKAEHKDMAITLCVGEKTKQEYALWKKAGADRYLLKVETTDKNIYNKLHPEMSFDNRIECLNNLKELGYQTGSGNLIGLKGQTIESIAKDIIYFNEYGFNMLGVGVFIPHSKTELADENTGDVNLTLKTIALLRIVMKKTHLPATTALGSLEEDFRIHGLKCGANVLMPNFTPVKYKTLYDIYPLRRCSDEAGELCIGCLQKKVEVIGRKLDFARGDALKLVIPAKAGIHVSSKKC